MQKHHQFGTHALVLQAVVAKEKPPLPVVERNAKLLIIVNLRKIQHKQVQFKYINQFNSENSAPDRRKFAQHWPTALSTLIEIAQAASPLSITE